jgi:transposase
MGNTTFNDNTTIENIVELKKRIAELETLVKYYEEQFRLAKHRQFGVSSEKSEYDGVQMSLFNEAETTVDVNVSEPELSEIKGHYRKRKRLTNDSLPDDIPVETVEYELTESECICPECGGELHVMGHDSRRELVIIPAQVKIREHRQAVYSCRRCENNSDHTPILKASVPEPVIRGSFASPEAIAHIMVQKYVMGLPLYRQEQEWHRNGIMLSRQTMSNWLIKAVEDWLEPIYERMKVLMLQRDVLHADETTLQVLNEQGKSAQSKSYMWLYRTGGDAERSIVLYEYKPDRSSRHPETFLKEFNGYLHADGYEGYRKLSEKIIVVGCWAHMRRKFDEALKILPEKDRGDSYAMRGKRLCDKLFDLEHSFVSMPPGERFAKRQEKSKPLVDEFFVWAATVNAPPKTALGKAIHYAVSQRLYLERFMLDGRLEICNNRAERSIKPFVIGRKNWLFSNTTKGAMASSVIYSIIETAKENGLNPFHFLVYIFNNAPNLNLKIDSDHVDILLPWKPLLS